MLTALQTVFLLDVDNTLLDNDGIAADLTARLDADFGRSLRERYWSLFAKIRDETGYADYLGALQAFRTEAADAPELLEMSAFLLDYPFSERLFPHALAALEHLRTLGETAIVSDGDIVFQPRKIRRSGLWDAVEGRVLVTLHKERSLDLMQRCFPADHYVMVDDKPHLLAAMKRGLDGRLTTIFVRQGHYASESQGMLIDPAPDLVIERIGDLCEFAWGDFKIPRLGQIVDPDRNKSPEPAIPEYP